MFLIKQKALKNLPASLKSLRVWISTPVRYSQAFGAKTLEPKAEIMQRMWCGAVGK